MAKVQLPTNPHTEHLETMREQRDGIHAYFNYLVQNGNVKNSGLFLKSMVQIHLAVTQIHTENGMLQ